MTKNGQLLDRELLRLSSFLTEVLKWLEAPPAAHTPSSEARLDRRDADVAASAVVASAGVDETMRKLSAGLADFATDVLQARTELLVDGDSAQYSEEVLDTYGANLNDLTSRYRSLLRKVRQRQRAKGYSSAATAVPAASVDDRADGASGVGPAEAVGDYVAPAGAGVKHRRATDSNTAQRAHLLSTSAPSSRGAAGHGQTSSSLERVSALQNTMVMRQTGEQLRKELERMDAVHALLARDADSLQRTRQAHDAYDSDAVESAARVRAYQRKDARDKLYVKVAFVAFCFLAGYIAFRRLGWFFLGLRLPGL